MRFFTRWTDGESGRYNFHYMIYTSNNCITGWFGSTMYRISKFLPTTPKILAYEDWLWWNLGPGDEYQDWNEFDLDWYTPMTVEEMCDKMDWEGDYADLD